MIKLSDPLGEASMEFLREQGVKLVDMETGEEISEETVKKKRYTATPKGKRIEK